MRRALAQTAFDPVVADGPADISLQPQVIDIFLQPGDFFFGDEDTRIRTLLGSCIAVTLWHPKRRMGGMCHFMLPTRGANRASELDGRYGDEAIELFMQHLRQHRTPPSDYQVKVFGGGDMFPASNRRGALQVGNRNVEHSLELLRQHGLSVNRKHVAGAGHRNVIFEVWSGDVWLRHVAPPKGQ